jgi:hypothetical protein
MQLSDWARGYFQSRQNLGRIWAGYYDVIRAVAGYYDVIRAVTISHAVSHLGLISK